VYFASLALIAREGTSISGLRSFPVALFRWAAMVLHVPNHEPAGIGALEAKWRDALLQPTSMGTTNRLSIAVR